MFSSLHSILSILSIIHLHKIKQDPVPESCFFIIISTKFIIYNSELHILLSPLYLTRQQHASQHPVKGIIVTFNIQLYHKNLLWLQLDLYIRKETTVKDYGYKNLIQQCFQ